MGLVSRKKSGRTMNTKLVVEGQGISTSTKPTPVSNEKLKIEPGGVRKQN